MTTKNNIIAKPSVEKLKVLNKELSNHINDSTEDLLKTTNQWSWWYTIRSQSVLKVVHHSRALLYGKLQFLKHDFEKLVVLYGEYAKKHMRLTSVEGDDKMLDIEIQHQEIVAQTDLHRTFSEVSSTYVAGNKAKETMLVSDSELNITEAECVKSDDYLHAVKNSVSEVKTYPEKPNLEFSQPEVSEAETIAPTEIPQEKISVESEVYTPTRVKPRQVIYTKEGDAPDYYVAEEQLEEAMYASGENYASQYSNPSLENSESLHLSTTSEKALKQPTYNQNILGHIGLDKVIWIAGVYVIAMGGEILIFSAIFSIVFNFDAVKSMVAGLAPLLLSFGIGYASYGVILNFTKSNNRLSRKLFSSRIMIIALFAGLGYAFCMGLLYKNTLDQDEIYGQMAIQKEELYRYNSDIIDENMSEEEKNETIRENGEKISETNTKLTELQTGWVPTVAKLTVAFSSLIFLLFSGLVFGVFILFLSAYKLQKKMAKIQEKLPRIEAEFYSQKNVIREVDNLSNRILSLLGQKRFIEKLLAGDSTRDILYTPPAKEEPKPNFSSNGKYHPEEFNINN